MLFDKQKRLGRNATLRSVSPAPAINLQRKIHAYFEKTHKQARITKSKACLFIYIFNCVYNVHLLPVIAALVAIFDSY